MKQIFTRLQKHFHNNSGFVLPFTLFICGIMLLISVSISTILTKQIFFSIVSKESQLAYYAADNAIACALSIEETYSGTSTAGIFPSEALDPDTTDDHIYNMMAIVTQVNDTRAAAQLPPLATAPYDIICAQSRIFDTNSPTNFYVNPVNYVRQLGEGLTEEGKTSSYNMKMDLGDNNYSCAKVTINKTPSFRQIIAQGYSKCDRPTGSIERAVINTQQ